MNGPSIVPYHLVCIIEAILKLWLFTRVFWLSRKEIVTFDGTTVWREI